MFKPGLRMVASALAATAMLVPTAVQAQTGGYGYGPTGGYGYERGYDAPPPPPPHVYVRGGYPQGGYAPPPPGYYDAGYGARPYRRHPRGYRCDRGTGGTILGAIAGGLLGNGIAGRGDRGAGTIIGAGVGALAGRAVDRNC